MTTRKQFLKDIGSVAALSTLSLNAKTAQASPHRGILGANGICYVNTKNGMPTAKDYVQDGLVTMWDGIENAGWGVHDAVATSWVDLINGIKSNVLECGTFNTNAFVVSTPKTVSLDSVDFYDFTDITIELILSDSFGRTSNDVYLEGDNNNKGISFQSNVSAFHSRFGCNVNLYFQYFISTSTTVPIGGDFRAYAAVTSSATSRETWWYCNGKSIYNYARIKQPFHTIGIGKRTSCCGEFHRIAIYSRALTAAEIAHNYSLDKKRFNLPD